MDYLPIEDYGIVGNMKTVALVGNNGSIDWFCYPFFDSPSIFGGILDGKKGGHFSIAPTTKFSSKQHYWPDTNVLLTRFHTDKGICEITDFMPVGKGIMNHDHNRLVRRVKIIRGKVDLRMECYPAFNYARDSYDVAINDCGVAFHSKDISIALSTSVPLQKVEKGVEADLTLSEGDNINFVIKEVKKNEKCDICFTEQQVNEGFRDTIRYWRQWLTNCNYKGRWRETVLRSALTLKLLTFEPSGAIVASPTCSLPEYPGGTRNWDYRYTWIRDAAFTVYAFIRIGFTEEASRFIDFIEARCNEREKDGSLQIMYGIDGRHQLKEEHLDHLEGYRGSKPVRVGNDAYDQLQLDIYGELMDSVYLYNKYGSQISYEFWNNLRYLVDWVANNWDQPDEGIWEVRSGKQNFVYSRLMSWVALDRGLRLANKRSFPCDRQRWLSIRDRIYEQIMDKGWNEDRQAFVQSYGSYTLDAANLLMPMVFFVSPSDNRMLKTLEAMNKSPDEGGLVSNSLVYRYNQLEVDDGLSGEEGTFNICTFWMVEAMTRAGQVDPQMLENARLMFEQMLGYANHLGLFSEETGLKGEALGNFPQAFTHLSLISSAFNLNRTLG